MSSLLEVSTDDFCGTKGQGPLSSVETSNNDKIQQKVLRLTYLEDIDCDFISSMILLFIHKGWILLKSGLGEFNLVCTSKIEDPVHTKKGPKSITIMHYLVSLVGIFAYEWILKFNFNVRIG